MYYNCNANASYSRNPLYISIFPGNIALFSDKNNTLRITYMYSTHVLKAAERNTDMQFRLKKVKILIMQEIPNTKKHIP